MLSEVALPELPILTNEGQSIEVCVTITDSQLISGSATVTLTSQGTDDRVLKVRTCTLHIKECLLWHWS